MKSKVVEKLVLLGLLVVVVLSSFSVIPITVHVVYATTETRYFANQTWATGLYNLSTTQTASNNSVLISSVYNTNWVLYMGVNISIIDTSNILHNVTNGVEVIGSKSIATTTGDWSVQVNWTHSAITQSGMGVQVDWFADEELNPPTTKRFSFRTENMTTFTGIPAGTWMFNYTGRTKYTSSSKNRDGYICYGNTRYNTNIQLFELTFPSNPTASNPTETLVVLSGENITVATYWTANGGDMDFAQAIWNVTGGATSYTNWYEFPASTSAGWANITITTPANTTADTYFSWSQYANNTNGYSTNSSFRTVLLWKGLPDVSAWNFGESAETPRGIYYNSTATGKRFVFIAYQNTTTQPWRNSIRAFDIGASAKTPEYTVGDCTLDDGHIAPDVTVLPDGRLMYFYGYGTTSEYYVSTYSADVETDAWTLISHWASVKAFPAYGEAAVRLAYLHAITFDDRAFFHGRAGATVYTVYKSSQTTTLWSDGNDSTYSSSHWIPVGSSPYLNDGDTSYIYRDSVSGTVMMGYFTFSDFSASYITDEASAKFQTTLQVYVYNRTTDVDVYLNSNGTAYSVGTLNATGWRTFNITNYANTATTISNSKIYFNASYGTMTISRANILINYTGFSEPTLLTDMEYYDIQKVSSTTMYLTGTPGGQYGNATFATSANKGDSWTLANGTDLSIPFWSNQTEIVDSGGLWQTITLMPVRDENAKPTIALMTRQNFAYIPSQRMRMLTYSTTVGNAGTWTYHYAEDEFGNMINGTDVGFYLDPWYGRPAIWCTNNQRMQKYVRMIGETYKFHSVYQSPTNYLWDARGTNIANAVEGYEVAMREYYMQALGNVTMGNLQQSMLANEFWGSRFQANMTTPLTTVRGNFNVTYGSRYWQAALYDDNNPHNLLGLTDNHTLSYGSTEAGWQTDASFLSPVPTITQGEYYWLAFRVSADSSALYYYSNDTSQVNGTLVFSLGSADVSMQENYHGPDDSYSLITGAYWSGQSFTPSQTHNLTSISLKLYKSSGSLGTITVGIRNTDGSGLPTGGDLINGTLSGVTTTPTWYNITMANNNTQLQMGVKYAIVVRVSSGTLRWCMDASSPTYSGGTYLSSVNSGVTWAANSNYDFLFEEYGFPVLPQAEFPNSFTATGHYNRTITIFAAPVHIVARGFGIIEAEMGFSATGTNTSLASANCEFRTLVADGTGVANATLFWNYTGTMISNGTITLEGVEVWANFTRILPATPQVIQWYIEASDTQNNTANTGLQNLTLTAEYPIEMDLGVSWLLQLLSYGAYKLVSALTPALSLLVNSMWTGTVSSMLGIGLSLTISGAWVAHLASSISMTLSLLLDSTLTMIVTLGFGINFALTIMSKWFTNVLSAMGISLAITISTSWSTHLLSSLGVSLSMTLTRLVSVFVNSALGLGLSLSILAKWTATIASALGITTALTIATKAAYSLVQSFNVGFSLLVEVVRVAVGAKTWLVEMSLAAQFGLSILTKTFYGITSTFNVIAHFDIFTKAAYGIVSSLTVIGNLTMSVIRSAIVNLSFGVNLSMTILQHAIMNVLLPFISLFNFSLPLGALPSAGLNLAFILAAFAVVTSLAAIGLFASRRWKEDED